MDQMIVTITLRKVVPDEAAARVAIAAVKAKVEDLADVTMTSHFTTHIDESG